MNFAGGISAVGDAIEKSGLEMQKAGVDQDKINLTNQLAGQRESQGRSETFGYTTQLDKQKQDAEIAKQKAADAAHKERTELEIGGRKDVANITGGFTLKSRQETADAARDAAETRAQAARDVADARGKTALAVQEMKSKQVADARKETELSADALDIATLNYIANGGVHPKGLGMGKDAYANKVLVENNAAKKMSELGITPEMLQSQEGQHKAAQAALTMLEKQTQAVLSFNQTADEIGKQLVELNNSYKDRTGIPLVNKFINATKEQITGDPELVKFNNFLNTYKAERAKILSGNMGNVAPTDKAYERVDQTMSAAMSKEGLEAAIKAQEFESNVRMKSLADQREVLHAKLQGAGTTKPAAATPASTATPTIPKTADNPGGLRSPPVFMDGNTRRIDWGAMPNGTEFTMDKTDYVMKDGKPERSGISTGSNMATLQEELDAKAAAAGPIADTKASLDAKASAVPEAKPDLSASAGRAAMESDPRFATPVPPDKQQPGELLPDFLQRRMAEQEKAKDVRPSDWDRAATRGNEHIANLAGAYSDYVQGPAIGLAVSAWKMLRGDQKELMAKDHPNEAAVMDFFQGLAEHPLVGSDMIKGWMGKQVNIPIPFTDKSIVKGSATIPMPEATTLEERAMDKAGPAAVDMATLGLGARAYALKAAGTAALESTGLARVFANYGLTGEKLAQVFQGGGFASNVAMGGAGGAAGEVGKETLPKLVPERSPQFVKDLAGVIGETGGNIAGGVAGGGIVDGFKSFVGKLVDSVFGNRYLQAAESLKPAPGDAGKLTGYEPPIEGLRPTTGQITENQTQLAAETKLEGKPLQTYNERAQANQTVRMNAIVDSTDPQSTAQAVQDYVKNGFENLKNFFSGNVAKANADAAAAVGDNLHGHPDEYATAVQKSMADLAEKEKQKVTALRNAIEPDKTVPVNIENLVKENAEIYRPLTENLAAEPPGGEEGKIQRVLADITKTGSPTQPFGTITTLQDRVVSAIREARSKGDMEAVDRLGKVLTSIDDTIAVHAGEKASTPAGKAQMAKDLREATRPDMEPVKVGDTDVLKNPTAKDVVQLAKDNLDGRIVVHRDPETGITHAWVDNTNTNQAVQDAVSRGNDDYYYLSNKGGKIYRTNPAENQDAVAGKLDEWMGGYTPKPGSPEALAAEAEANARAPVTSTLTQQQADNAGVLYGVRPFGGGNKDVFVTKSLAQAQAQLELIGGPGKGGNMFQYRPTEGAVITPSRTNHTMGMDGSESLFHDNIHQSGGYINENQLQLMKGTESGVDENVARRFADYQKAKEGYRQLYESGPTGEMLHPDGEPGSFKMGADAISRKIFDNQAKLEAYIKSAGGDSNILGTLQDWAAFSMKDAATGLDGMISPQKLERWVADHQHVMDSFPDLKAKFSNIKSAQETLDQATANQKAAIEAYERGSLGKIMGAAPENIQKVVGKTLEDSNEFGRLVDTIKSGGQMGVPNSDGAALEGLKKAVIGHMMDSTGNTENLLNGKGIIDFLQNYEASLSKLFSPEELQGWRTAATGFKEASEEALKESTAPSGKEIAALAWASKLMAHHVVGKTLAGVAGLGALTHSWQASLATTLIGGLFGAAADRVATNNAAKLKAAVADLLLNPEKAAIWFGKVTDKAAPEVIGSTPGQEGNITIPESVARRLRTAGANATVQTMRDYAPTPEQDNEPQQQRQRAGAR